MKFKRNWLDENKKYYVIKACQFIFIFAGMLHLFAPYLIAEDIAIGVVHTRLPYIIKKTDSGIEVDIVREIFKIRGHKAQIRYLTNKRAGYFLKIGKVDVFITNKSYDTSELGIDVFYSDSHITYHNHAITLTKNHLKINSPSDLMGKRVIGFQNAHKYLGAEYAAMAERNPNYKEKPEQSIQIFWLFTGRTDVVIADKKIFKYHRMLSAKKGQFSVTEPVTFHPIFSPSPIHGIFLNKEMRDEFNKGLTQLKKSGRYDEIINSYELLMKID
ncbi:MAG: amino acid ABC transporter substrate-binding protein [Desulfobacterales bacterium]|nr:amino acid ABC transporter substrate-binding protein [Desulfobacterales bacterium]